ncbi:MAG: PEP-CTERM sorting domain-containing protein [Phycisphaeraceae bacterium]|nr:PEP-CTERM sorting domain-containing protein [Phycisphaeraceae bacterium]MBX3365818.1 PEP-CTERM sorting domain-containing protein [Phycisphaeraceae bacterium]
MHTSHTARSVLCVSTAFLCNTACAEIRSSISFGGGGPDVFLYQMTEPLHGSQSLIYREVQEGTRNMRSEISWGDPAMKWSIMSREGSFGSEFESYQSTTLEVKRKRSELKWLSPGGEWKTSRVDTYTPQVSNVVLDDATIDASFTGFGGLLGSITSLGFSSSIKNGTITYTVTNSGDQDAHVKWAAASIDILVPKNKSHSVSVRSPRNAVERHGVAIFNWDPDGVGALPMELPLMHFARPAKVPTPGTMAIAGIAGLVMARRRR